MEIWGAVLGLATAFIGFASRLNLRLTAEERRRLRIERDLELLAVLPKGPAAKRLRDAIARATVEMLAERERDKSEEQLTRTVLVSGGTALVALVISDSTPNGSDGMTALDIVLTAVGATGFAIASFGLLVLTIGIALRWRRRWRARRKGQAGSPDVVAAVTE